MKKILRKILWALTAIVLVIILFFIFYAVRAASAKKMMTPAETSQITGDVYAVRDDYVNMYLIKDGEDFVAVDAGIKKSSVKSELKKLNIDPDRVKIVLLTHSDSDHAGGIGLFDKAEICLPRMEEQLINGETGRFLFFGNKISREDYKVIDDETFKSGSIKIKPIFTPGHTPGSTCYQINDKYLFVGDAMRLYNGYAEPFPKFINKSARGARKSMKKLTDLENVQYIFTGHYGFSSDYPASVNRQK